MRLLPLSFTILLSAWPPSQAADKPAIPAPGRTLEFCLGPEDVLDIFVWKEPELSTTVTVRPDGKISLPLAGEMQASGKTALEIQRDLTSKLQEFIKQPVITVIVKQINSLKISVLGEVRKPDVYKIKNRITVLDAVAMAGGFTDLARPNHVVVLRKTAAGSMRLVVNVNQLVDDKNGTPFYLEPSDTVYVEGR